MPSAKAKTRKLRVPATEPERRVRAQGQEHNMEAIERLLLLTFVTVAAITAAWHLGMSIEWLWGNCAAQLHSVASARMVQ